MTELMQKTAAALEQNGFDVQCFETAAEAAAYVLAQAQPGDSIGVGGSVTIRQLGVAEALREQGHPVYWHWFTPNDRQTYLNANMADLYLTSSNAITASGILVNIDATGNRVAAMIYGPKRVIVVCGTNKLVDGSIPAAIARIKRDACPPNARRLGKDTPCSHTGICDAAHCTTSLCHATSFIDKPTLGHPMTIVLINEELGY